MNQEHQKQSKVSHSFHVYYPLSNIPETQLLRESEYFLTHRNLQTSLKGNRTNNRNPTSTTEILIALGFITALLCFAGVQLHRSVNVGSAKVEKQAEKAITFSPLKSFPKISPKQFAWRIY